MDSDSGKPRRTFAVPSGFGNGNLSPQQPDRDRSDNLVDPSKHEKNERFIDHYHPVCNSCSDRLHGSPE
ncbi:MAG: hypothetical protein KDC41_27080, partial [Saprospiraceae bacterium]|nr:hypothetical protein [Saprospiraceae bacterium]